MVADLYFVVNVTVVRLPVFGTHDVINAHEEAVAVVTDTGSVAGRYEAVGKVLGRLVVGVGDGAVVEIATNDDTLVAVVADVACQGVSLRGALGGGFGQLMYDQTRFVAGLAGPSFRTEERCGGEEGRSRW